MSPQQLHKHYNLPASVATSHHRAQPFNLVHEEHSLEGLQYVLRLLWVGQSTIKQTTNMAERLCQEITSITQGKAQLILKNAENNPLIPQALSRTLFSFSVQFGDVIYGTLCIVSDSEQPTAPALPFPIAQLLAQVCSWLLYTFEQSIFLQGQCQHLNDPGLVSLTKREREVLKLMCLGYNQQSIAQELNISPTTVGKHRQHIYEQLGVHNERDALLAAYHFGLFSILDLPNM